MRAYFRPDGAAAMRRLLKLPARPDAVFCFNDLLALGALRAIHEAGLRVPEDIALVGYDNWDAMALACRPPLTTVDMNLVEVGRVAALRLMEAIDGHPSSGVQRVPSRLMVRESTGSAAS